MAWLQQWVDRQLLLECGRLLLLSVSAAYVGANMRRLAVKRGWDTHLLRLSEMVSLARQRPRRWWRRLVLTVRRRPCCPTSCC